MNVSKIIIAAVAAVSLTTAVQAQESRSILVETAGYDLTNPQVVEKMQERISVAARNLCGVGTERDLKLDRMTRDCAKASIAKANANLEQQVASARQLRSETTVALATPAKK